MNRLQQRATLQAAGLNNAINAAFEQLHDSRVLDGGATKKDVIALVFKVAEEAFRAGVETQSDAVQLDFADYERRISELYQQPHGRELAYRN